MPDLNEDADWEFRAAPRVVRLHAIVWSVVLPGAALLGWFALPAEIRAQFTGPQVATLLFFLAFMVAFVWVLASGWVKAGRRGLQFRNGLRRHELEWSQVEGIRYGPGDAWAFVLVDSPVERLPLMGIMRTDGPRADDDVEQLRRLAATYAR